jgi:glycosyltransferase involved in cell wall biosynthesis
MSLENKTIFLFGTAKYDGPFESTSFTLAKHLAKKNTVFYIDYPFTWKDYLQRPDKGEFERRAPYFHPGSDGIIQTDIPGLKVLIPPPLASINFLPEGKLYRLLLRWNEKLILRRLKKLIRKEQIAEYIYINSFNFHYPGIAEGLSPALQVYQCVDPLIIDYDKKHGVVSERILATKSDLIICTSKELYEQKKLLNPNTFFIPNAADISHSSKVLDPHLPVHESIAGIPRPIIGYFGTIERRMDFPLLTEIIGLNSDKSFVFAGPVSKDVVPEAFLQLPNAYFPGRMPYEQMPSILKGFDVALIPFKIDEVSRTVFPLKLFEYLGAGKPVVATNFNPDLKEFTGDTVLYCGDAASFSAAIDACLYHDDEEKKRKRIEVAEQNTWEKRGDEIAGLIDQYFIQKTSNLN